MCCFRDPKTRAIVDKALQSTDPKFFTFLSKVETPPLAMFASNAEQNPWWASWVGSNSYFIVDTSHTSPRSPISAKSRHTRDPIDLCWNF